MDEVGPAARVHAGLRRQRRARHGRWRLPLCRAFRQRKERHERRGRRLGAMDAGGVRLRRRPLRHRRGLRQRYPQGCGSLPAGLRPFRGRHRGRENARQTPGGLCAAQGDRGRRARRGRYARRQWGAGGNAADARGLPLRGTVKKPAQGQRGRRREVGAVDAGGMRL